MKYNFNNSDWTIARDYSLDVLGAGVVFENYVTFDTITEVPETVTVGIAAGTTYTDSFTVQSSLGTLFGMPGSVSASVGLNRALTFSAEVELDTTNFVNNYMEQGNLDSDISGSEFALSLADLMVPGFGDSFWEDVYGGLLGAGSVLVDVAISRQDTFAGILENAPDVELSLDLGSGLTAGASIGLGATLPVAPLINAGASISAGVTLVGLETTTHLWDTTVPDFSFNPIA